MLCVVLGGGGGGHTSARHWIRAWASPNKWVTIEKQADAMVKTKDLYSAYCPTGRCTHHLPFSLILLPGRLLHSYMYALVYMITLVLQLQSTGRKPYR